MYRSLFLASAFVVMTATAAFAFHCPQDAAAIDAALAKMEISDTLRAEVIALRDEGIALHEAGNHADSEAKLADAMRRLLLAL